MVTISLASLYWNEMIFIWHACWGVASWRDCSYVYVVLGQKVPSQGGWVTGPKRVRQEDTTLLWSPYVQPTGAKGGCRLPGYLWQALNTFMFSCFRGGRTNKQALRSRYAHSRESPCGSSSGSWGGTRGAGWVLCLSVLMPRTLMIQVWLVSKLYCALFMHDDHQHHQQGPP